MNKDEAREAAVRDSRDFRDRAVNQTLTLLFGNDTERRAFAKNTLASLFDMGASEQRRAASVDRRAIVDRWQSMESAPKTGEHIQVINVDGHGFGFCGSKRQHASDIVHWFVDGFYSSIFGTDQKTPMTFTHWRPLPDKDAVLAEMEANNENSKM